MKHRQDWQNSEGRILTVNVIKEGSENKPALLILLNVYLKNHKNLTFQWIKTIENGGKSHYEINVFLKYTIKQSRVIMYYDQHKCNETAWKKTCIYIVLMHGEG